MKLSFFFLLTIFFEKARFYRETLHPLHDRAFSEKNFREGKVTLPGF